MIFSFFLAISYSSYYLLTFSTPFRFVWVNALDDTIHMSQHMSKDRRHKEANLDDVTSVISGLAPKLIPDGDKQQLPHEKLLTINFKKGGGIDLIFNTERERDEWHDAIQRISHTDKYFTPQ